MRALLLLLAALGLTACATTQKDPGPSGLAWSEIGIAEGACFGTCPIYSIRITPDDHYQLTSERFTHNSGETSGTLEPGSFERLAAILQAHDVASIPADITPNNPAACGTVATDMPDYHLRLVSSSGERRIAWYPGCFGSPYREAMSDIRTSLREVYDYESLIAPKR